MRIGLFSQDKKLYLLIDSVFRSQLETLQMLDAGEWDRARELVCQGAFDLLILDLDSNYGVTERMLEFHEQIASAPVSVVVTTYNESRSVALELVQRVARNYCRKPPVIPELRAAVTHAYEYGQLRRETETQLNEPAHIPSLDRLIGSSSQMEAVFDLIRRVTDLNASVLITGESGTGKELVARAIHNLGRMAKRPFVAVSCGAIPETLIEAELFGHEKGAFTGTVGAREGYFEQAADGTLFLDEIGDLSSNTQVKLLRVLQQREFSRLGSARTIPLRARLLFATHRNLAEAVAQGTFRQDLYYRINVMEIECPALADRPEDIPMLANSFLQRYSRDYGKPLKGIQAEAMALLESHGWPGNVRELENVIQRAIIIARGDQIGVEDLPEAIGERGLRIVNPDAGCFEQQVRQYKTKLAYTAIQECNGNKTLAARNLNISRAYLHRLIRAEEPDAQAV